MNDTVVVTVMHDEQEESLVKNIFDSFEPNDRVTTDNFTHIYRHRIHLPDDSKIMTRVFVLSAHTTKSVALFAPYNLPYTSPVSCGVVKPPPRFC